MPWMSETMRERFDGVPDPIRIRGTGLSDCLMSGLAVFSFKTPSLPRFDRNTRGGGDPVMARNLHALFGVARAPQQSPSGTRMRGRLDEVGPRQNRGGALENRTALGGPFPMAVDGTGTCHHRTPGAAIIHPDLREVPPPGPKTMTLADRRPRQGSGLRFARQHLAHGKPLDPQRRGAAEASRPAFIPGGERHSEACNSSITLGGLRDRWASKATKHTATMESLQSIHARAFGKVPSHGRRNTICLWRQISRHWSDQIRH